jgi:hypothetical protein
MAFARRAWVAQARQACPRLALASIVFVPQQAITATLASEGDRSAGALFDHLGCEEGECAVYSAIYRYAEGGELHLQHASLLVGPAQMAAASWGAWMLTGSEFLRERFEKLADAPAEGLVDSAPVLGGSEIVAGRTAMEVEQAREWFEEALASNAAPAVGELPAAKAPLLSPSAPLHVFPRLWTPTSRLGAAAIRPQRGFLFPLATELEPLVATEWELGGITAFDGPWSTLGIALPHKSHRIEPPPQGLFIGRLERRAWFNDVRGDGVFNRYQLHIGIEPDRVDLAELEVELEEWDGDDLVNCRRLRLGDLKLGQRAGAARFVVSLPTLGRKLAHEARLYDREGTLLDRTQRSKLVEQMTAKSHVVGQGGDVASHEFTIGKRVDIGLAERLDRFDRLDEDYRQMLREGLEERIISTAQQAEVLREELATVTKPLSIHDPFFGAHTGDWAALAKVKVPVRILTGKRAKAVPPNLVDVELRRWRGAALSPPFHDRFYLWEGGGLSVGTSPSGLGKRDARIDRIGATEAAGWLARFEAYWQNPDFAP